MRRSIREYAVLLLVGGATACGVGDNQGTGQPPQNERTMQVYRTALYTPRVIITPNDPTEALIADSLWRANCKITMVFPAPEPTYPQVVGVDENGSATYLGERWMVNELFGAFSQYNGRNWNAALQYRKYINGLREPPAGTGYGGNLFYSVLLYGYDETRMYFSARGYSILETNGSAVTRVLDPVGTDLYVAAHELGHQVGLNNAGKTNGVYLMDEAEPGEYISQQDCYRAKSIGDQWRYLDPLSANMSETPTTPEFSV